MSFSSSIPLYQKRPLFDRPPLPEPDPSCRMTLEMYLSGARKDQLQFDKLDLSDEVLKKVVFDEIRKIPEAWSMTNNKRNYLEMIAVEIYRRTGTLLSVASIRNVYKCGKDNLRSRLRRAIVNKRLSPEQVEKFMWRWDHYPYIRFYREKLQDWERELEKEVGTVQKERGQRIEQKNEEEDLEIIGVEEHQYEDDDWDNGHSFQGNEEESPYQHLNGYQDEAPSSSDFQQHPLRKRQKLSPLEHKVFERESSSGSLNDGVAPTTTTSFSMPAADFQEEMAQITYQATRIAREQPERIKLLRKALFDTVLAFDDKEYDNIGDLFSDLAGKYSRLSMK